VRIAISRRGRPRRGPAGETSRPRNGPGFTLFELLIALTIMAAVLALALPALPRLVPGVTLDAATVEVMAMLRQARATAIHGNRPVGVAVEDGRITVDGTWARAMPVAAAPALSFYPDGASNGGALVVAVAGRSRGVTVDPLTGRVALAGP